MRTLFLQAPSFDGFDGGAGSRYQARREIRSFWYPTWLAQVAAMVPDSKLIDAIRIGSRSPTSCGRRRVLILRSCTPRRHPSLRRPRVMEAIKDRKPAAQGRISSAPKSRSSRRAVWKAREPSISSRAMSSTSPSGARRRPRLERHRRPVLSRRWRYHQAQSAACDPPKHGRTAVCDAPLQGTVPPQVSPEV